MSTNEKLLEPDEVRTYLQAVRVELEKAVDASEDSTEDLHDLITWVRSTGRVSVNNMASAMGRKRNYVDSAWSIANRAGREPIPAWFNIPEEENAAALLAHLARYSDAQRKAYEEMKVVRQKRDSAVAMVYASKVMGPSEIAKWVGIDRNHVGRISRVHGVAPQHRSNIRNQYSDQVRLQELVSELDQAQELDIDSDQADAA